MRWGSRGGEFGCSGRRAGQERETRGGAELRGRRAGAMGERTLAEAVQLVLDEVKGALAQVAPEEAASLVQALLEARRVFAAGEGRSGLVARALAMRLRHLGRESYVTGETI